MSHVNKVHVRLNLPVQSVIALLKVLAGILVLAPRCKFELPIDAVVM